jgi:hypothetical protein
MPHDPGVAEAALYVLGGKFRHLSEIEAGKGAAKVLALAKDGQP